MRVDQEFQAVLAAETALLSQRNSLLSFKQGSASGRNPFDNLKHILVGFSKQSIDFSKLAFLGTGDDPQLIIELDVAQESFRMAVETTALRNKLLDNYFSHPETEIVSLDEETGIIRAKGNTLLARNLRQVNEAAFESFNRAEEINIKTFDRLYKFAVDRFPHEKKMPLPPPSNAL